jgi:hypothetical protein
VKRGQWAGVALAVALLLGALSVGVPPGTASPPPAVARATTASWAFQAITESPATLTMQSNLTVTAELTDITGITSIDFTFCQISFGLCYIPIGMTPVSAGSHWYTGTTDRLSTYSHMKAGVHAGFNITVRYGNQSNASIPTSTGGQPDAFSNFLAVQAVASGDYYFQVVVANPSFGVSGIVTDKTTGAAIAGATVSLNSTNVSAATTSANGSYALANVPSGNYTLTVAKAGYSTVTELLAVGSAPVSHNVYLTKSASSGTSGGASNTFFGLPATEAFAAIGVAVVAVLALLFLAFRPKRSAPTPPSAAAPAATETRPKGSE